MNSLNDNIYTALGTTQDKKVHFWALGRGPIQKVSYILPHKLTITGNPSIHLPCVWGGKWGQSTVSILKLVPNIGIFAWATETSLHSREKEWVWEAEQSSQYCWGFLYQVLWF